MNNRREVHKDRRLLAFLLEQFCPRIFRDRLIAHRAVILEVAACALAAHMNDTLRDTSSVEVGLSFVISSESEKFHRVLTHYPRNSL